MKTIKKDDISDIAIEIVDAMVFEKLIPNCIDTDNEAEFLTQDIIREKLEKFFKINN
tara:strand:- start:242 stop:412 length:171 start_codon:yes stop_codon:yes gene_type:complete